MFDTAPLRAPIVFLHIPKTAGQTVHNELARAVGQQGVSPIRVHGQAPTPDDQLPKGHRFYSGHIDWLALDQIEKPRFVFSILRDPRGKISFGIITTISIVATLVRGKFVLGKRFPLFLIAANYARRCAM